MPFEGVIVHCEVAIPIMESTLVSGPRSLHFLQERSTRISNPRLIVDNIEDIIDWYSKGNMVKLCFPFLVRPSERLGRL